MIFSPPTKSKLRPNKTSLRTSTKSGTNEGWLNQRNNHKHFSRMCRTRNGFVMANYRGQIMQKHDDDLMRDGRSIRKKFVIQIHSSVALYNSFQLCTFYRAFLTPDLLTVRFENEVIHSKVPKNPCDCYSRNVFIRSTGKRHVLLLVSSVQRVIARCYSLVCRKRYFNFAYWRILFRMCSSHLLRLALAKCQFRIRR
jgi:hypothetical protein